MKCYKAKFAIFTSFIIVLLYSTYGFAQENDVDNYKIIFKFKTIKQADNSRLLEVSFIGQNRKNKKDKIPIYGAEIEFINYTDVEKVELGTYKTSDEGIAQLTLAENHQYLMDESGYIHLTAHFEGNDAIGEQDAEISVKDLHLELDLKEIDSIKTVFVNAYTADVFGKEIPVNDVDIIISVGSMFSKMVLAEESIEEGKFKFDFPLDLQGDVNKNLIVYSLIDDHEEYGTVIQSESIDWGIYNKQIKAEGNTLWTHGAPTWMYIVLTILLVGVWANYLYTIVNLFKIKKEGNNLELESEL
jgi:hypothetical protein